MSAEEDRSVCTPCRGTGRLMSNLGDEPHELTCPWCGGSGQFEAGRDAQEHPAEEGRSQHSR
jgi:DnaJ-class molecular chaperone